MALWLLNVFVRAPEKWFYEPEIWQYAYVFLCVGDMIGLPSISVLNAFALGKLWFENP
jgi:hypothetical protein